MSTETLAMQEQVESQNTGIIDLRSDTVTQPTAAMRTAMAAASVGDDVYGEDPAVLRLEARAAEVFSKEAAIFVPSGTMGNQIAIRLHTRPGQEVVCEARAHILDWEMAMASTFSGCQLRPVAGDRGALTWDRIKPFLTGKSYHRAQTGLIAIENTHNMAGGTATPLEVMEEVWTGAKEAGLPVHLDGARIFNASTALGIPVAKLTQGFDTVMFCLSKGLCAPVGSMLVGSAELMDRARILRKALGGGMRQAGVLAAPGLIALDEMIKRLGDDHANARGLADRLAELDEIEIDLETVQTNIVIFTLRHQRHAAEFVGRMKRRNILVSQVLGPHSIRLVTHHDVDRFACERAAQILCEEIKRS